MKLTSIKKAIVDRLKQSIPNVKIYAGEIEQGFKRPVFFVQMIPFGLSFTNRYHTAKSLNIDIHYFSPNETDLENLDMTDSLMEAFQNVLAVENRRFLIENIETEDIDKVLHFKFDIQFTDTTDGIVIVDTEGKEITVPVQDLDPQLGYNETSIDLMTELEVKEEV